MRSIFLIKPLTIRTKMALFSFGLVLLAIMVGGFLLIQKVTVMFEDEMGLHALAIARTLAQMDEIKDNVGQPNGWEVIQPIAEKTRLATGVAYIVVLDMHKIRYSHPVQDRIGKKFTDQDIGAALANHELISRAEGVLGPSIRAFVPIKVDEGTRQVGVVVVGVLTPTAVQIWRSIHVKIYSFLAVGLVIGLLGSLFLAHNIKKAMLSMEPGEIARLLQERIAIFQAMSEGVVAIDTNLRITVLNEEARRLLGLENDVVGRYVYDVIPDSNLPEIIKSGKPVFNQERVINNTIIISNRLPVKVNGEIVGAVSTFKDKTEVNALAEELTGVKLFVEALRVQNHENANKLHTIAGLVELGHYQQAIDYIFDITGEQQKVTGLINKQIHDYRMAGLLLGKFARSKELKIELNIDPKSYLKYIPDKINSSDLVIIAGNLIENAFEAVQQAGNEKRKVYFKIYDTAEQITIEVRDWGPGIDPQLEHKIFEQGFSTKGTGRGIGLHLVKRTVENLNGSIKIIRPENTGVLFKVMLPKQCKPGDGDIEYPRVDY
ncbi:ATP-binding protein [Desulfallas thermosapovorans]|uniref:histidine kinase n=1 Tax=Desulfallas thermosapovorans DSM 6562 TaxID=1121431 RepID=A0A5S4ZWP3_9FIRM|nr:sensor histidine kinase [Desulfallas thermosapovorans]TYO97448.1 two-component system sensor histidine kinase DctS [Desulfallas thermosapovorans DSM 6562]